MSSRLIQMFGPPSLVKRPDVKPDSSTEAAASAAETPPLEKIRCEAKLLPNELIELSGLGIL